MDKMITKELTSKHFTNEELYYLITSSDNYKYLTKDGGAIPGEMRMKGKYYNDIELTRARLIDILNVVIFTHNIRYDKISDKIFVDFKYSCDSDLLELHPRIIRDYDGSLKFITIDIGTRCDEILCVGERDDIYH